MHLHSTRTRTLALLLLACCACARTQPAAPAPKSAPATIAGQLALTGELARVRRGSVTVEAWDAGEVGREGAQPILARTYAIGDPDWVACEGELRHYFGLCDADRVGDAARTLPDELEIEACFDPDGLSGTHEGRVLGSSHARNGAKEVRITVSPRIETAQPTESRKKGG